MNCVSGIWASWSGAGGGKQQPSALTKSMGMAGFGVNLAVSSCSTVGMCGWREP